MVKKKKKEKEEIEYWISDEDPNENLKSYALFGVVVTIIFIIMISIASIVDYQSRKEQQEQHEASRRENPCQEDSDCKGLGWGGYECASDGYCNFWCTH